MLAAIRSKTDLMKIMTMKKNIFIIIGSAGRSSANEKLMDNFADLTKDDFNLTIFKDLKILPHFDPELSIDNPPKEIIKFRKNIENADGIIICTPEYVFSIPSGLKNGIEWCVSTTVFSGKPIGLITASANGQKGHEELLLIMKTVMSKFTEETTLLINGIKGKINEQGQITDWKTKDDFMKFIDAFKKLTS
jgi:chromate reductase, NAD(P)H dehydrogenase (quinone)